MRKVETKRMQWLLDHVSHEGDDCLIWPFTKTADGYGVSPARGGAGTASSVMCELAHGERPEGMEAAHSCGVRPCVNPRHLRWATRSENAQDKTLHGRLTEKRIEESGIESFVLAAQFPMKCRWPFKQAVIETGLTAREWLAAVIDVGLKELGFEPVFWDSVQEDMKQRKEESSKRRLRVVE